LKQALTNSITVTDLSFLQCQSARTRLATDQSVDATTNAVKYALERCDDVKAWNEGPYDFYAESKEGRHDDGYRSNVEVYERDDRTHVVVDTGPLLFVGSHYNEPNLTWRAGLDLRHDYFHDAIMTAIVASLTDTPERQISPDAWEQRSDVGIEENASTQHSRHSDSPPAEPSADGPSDEQGGEPDYRKQIPDRDQEPYDPHSENVAGIVVVGLGIVAFVSLPLAFAISFVLGLFAAIAGAFVVLVAVVIYQESFDQSPSE
jgi:hypothetical protein